MRSLASPSHPPPTQADLRKECQHPPMVTHRSGISPAGLLLHFSPPHSHVQLRVHTSSSFCVKPSPNPSFTGTSLGVMLHIGHSLFLTSDDRIQIIRLCL
ncbi:hypothetical protein E2C01_013732 [Portunus trituberculatus]|uniref:Uncharacterized protein n=1 Tax=Portunus trituberculatus TaxID=210409 RepID=A0A5B7DI33_PORTR|nr:hypothetical protein [Portunus trituberculatus]